MPTSSAQGFASDLRTDVIPIGIHAEGVPTNPLRPGVRRADGPWPTVKGYDILSAIGAGGMGIVYKARQRDLNRVVALKMIRAAFLDDLESRERFQAEAQATAKLQHPNIIQVFEVGAVESSDSDWKWMPFIAFEFVGGGNLEQRIGEPQAPLEAAQMVIKLARATHAAHGVGVIHRDLKPANVLLTPAGEPKIADFGVAKQVDGCHGGDPFVTQEGMTVGTPHYMAPEQVDGKAVTPAIDIYALGVILYELLTGVLPFQADTPMRTLELVVKQDPVSPRLLQPGLPRDLETICLKCLEKSPERRYASAEALADDLTRWTEGKPIQARAIGRVEHGTRWVRRNPEVAALSALVMFVALTGLAGVIWKWREAKEHAVSATLAARRADDRAEAERWERYRSGIVAASSAIQVHNVVAARRALEGVPEEHRNWEWRYLYRQLDVSHAVDQGTDRKEQQYLTSPNGLQIGRLDGSVMRLWDGDQGKNVQTVELDPALGHVLSNDGQLAITRRDHSVLVRNLTSGTETVLRGHTDFVSGVQFSADGDRIATSSHDGTARVWDTRSGRRLLELRGFPNMANELVFSPDGAWLASARGDDRTALVWNARTGAHVATLPGHQGDVSRVCFSPDGTRLATVDHFPSFRLRLWETATGKPIAVLEGHANVVNPVTFSPDGARIASAGLDQTIRIWDGINGKALFTLRGHSGWVTCVRFSPDGKQLASTSHDKTVRLWDVATGTSLAVLHGHVGAVHNVAYLKDATTLVSHSRDGSIRTWNLEELARDGQLIGHANFVYDVAIHPDGKHVASAAWDGTVRVWDSLAGRQVLRIDHPRQTHEHTRKTIATAVAYHPQGKYLASMGRAEAVYLWNATTGDLVHEWKLPTHPFLEARLKFSPDGSLLATGCKNGSVRLWNVDTKADVAVLDGHRDAVRDVAFSPDGRWLASGGDCNDRTIRIWNVANRTLVRVLEGHIDRVNTLTFSADGKLLASGSTDGTARLWDPAAGKLLGTLKHESNVYGLAFTPDGLRLATACADNTIRFWAVATHHEVAELRGHKDYVHSIAFTPDGQRLVSASGDFTLRTWDSPQPTRREP